MFDLMVSDRREPDESATLALSRSISTDSGVCLKHSYGRGVGTALINRCHDDEEAYGALCYPVCRDGYQAIGCCICRQRGCPPDFQDDGATTCIKPQPYGRGAGFFWKFSDGLNDKGMFQRCEGRNGVGNCEKSGAIVYPKCRSGFRAIGCCICSPRCPDEMTDLGISCEKHAYGRGVGASRLGCADDKENDAALCYVQCKDDYYGVGPVCWQNCSSDISHNCGVMCSTDSESCATATASIVLSAAAIGIKVTVGDLAGATAEAAEIVANVLSEKYC